jgi:hypothetical protein
MVFSMMYFWKQPQKIIFDLPNQTNVNVCTIQILLILEEILMGVVDGNLQYHSNSHLLHFLLAHKPCEPHPPHLRTSRQHQSLPTKRLCSPRSKCFKYHLLPSKRQSSYILTLLNWSSKRRVLVEQWATIRYPSIQCFRGSACQFLPFPRSSSVH